MPPFRGFLGLAIILCGICLLRLVDERLPEAGWLLAEAGRLLSRNASEPWLAVVLSLLLLPLVVTTLARLTRR